MTPPPITTMLFGRASKLKASVEVMTRFLSSLMNGRDAGFDPVAMIMCSPRMLCALPFSGFTSTVCASLKLPKPWCTVIPFFFIKKSMPPTVCSTTSPLRAIMRLKSNFNPPVEMPWVSNWCAAWWKCSELSSNALDGMHPTFKQVPPRELYFSTNAVFLPNCAARMAATYPPGPLPITMTSYDSMLQR